MAMNMGKKMENKRKSSFSSYSLAIINNVFPKYCTLYKLSSVSPVVLRKRFQKSILIPVVKIGFLQYFSFLSAILLLAQTLQHLNSQRSPILWGDTMVREHSSVKSCIRVATLSFGVTAVPCWHPFLPHLPATDNVGGKKATPIRKVRTEY